MVTALPTPAEMSVWDNVTIKQFGLHGSILMENASRGALEVLKLSLKKMHAMSAVVFAGPGNNGGDAFALARHLVNEQVNVHLLHTKLHHEYINDSAYHLRLALAMGIPCSYLPEYELELMPKVDIVIDGLLGTGLHGDLNPAMASWIKAINKLGETSFVLSLDIPSGLNGLTGHAMPIAVKANTTVTFEAPKLGLFLPSAKPFVGRLETVKIGIPPHIKEQNPVTHVALTKDLHLEISTPGPTIHKGNSGHVLVLGGSPGLTGAPLLAARAAMRAGAGLVTIAGPRMLCSAYASFPEVMTLGLGASDDWNEACADELHKHLQRFNAIVIGPGLGRKNDAHGFLTKLLSMPRPPAVVDADALFHLAEHPELFDLLGTNDILTPHPGEMGMLYRVSASQINAERFDYARRFAEQHRPTLVLKGPATIVARAGQPVAISPFSTPNLAVAGSGDVLAGVVGCLLGQEYPPLTAAMIGVYWHGFTGTLLARDFPFRGNTPLEIADYLPKAIQEWKNANS